MITADTVVRKGLLKLNAEHNTLAMRAMEIRQELISIEERMLEIKVEEEIFESYQQRGNITHTVTTTHSVTVTGKSHDKLTLEDALKAIFDASGIPLKFGEIRSKLEDFEFTWSTYNNAQYNLRKHLESTGAYGYYQYRR